MVSRREEVDELFEGIGGALDRDVRVLVIGGAALLEYGLKDSTKDIDVVCDGEVERESLLRAAHAIGCELKGPEERHRRLNIRRIAVRGSHVLDIFARTISSGFVLTEGMWQRAAEPKRFGRLEVRHASKEDIFIMKLIAGRAGDIEDCSSIASSGIGYDVVYREIEQQYMANDHASRIWITYIEESIGRLESYMDVPIADRISELADSWREEEMGRYRR